MDVGVRELKQHLAEYLGRAERGEVIRITDRGVPKVLLSPLPGAGLLARGIDEGWIRPPATSDILGPAVRHGSRRTVQQVLDEDRGA